MKKQRYLLVALTLIALVSAWSCTKENQKTEEPKPLETPVVTVKEVTRTNVSFTWENIKDASGYVFQILTNNEMVVEKQLDDKANMGSYQGLTAGTDYTVQVKALGPNSPKDDSEWGKATFKTEAPLTYVEFKDKVLEKYILELPTSIDENNDKIIQFAEAEKLTELEVNFESEEDATPEKTITDLSGLENFTNLKKLGLKYHKIKDVTPIEGLTSLTHLNIGENPVSKLDLSKLSNLVDLRLYGTRISELDFAATPNLVTLYAQRCALKKADLTPLTKLEEAYLNKNESLTSLNATGLKVLRRLDAVECNISEAKVSDCESLLELHLNNNKLTGITLTGLPKLMRLNLYSNNISELDVTNLPFLMWIFVFDNNISELDFSKNAALSQVMVSKNPLKILDFSANEQFASLEAESMPELTLINLKNNFYDEWNEYIISFENPKLTKVVTDEGPEFDHVKRLFKDNPNVTVTTTLN